MIINNQNINRHPSFKAVSGNTIDALRTEITGQKVNRGRFGEYKVEQEHGVKYRQLSDLEQNCIVKINEKARQNNDFDVHVVENDSNKNRDSYLNKYGDALAIINRKTKTAVRIIPAALGKKLTPEQQINNLKFAVDCADELSRKKHSGIRKLFTKPYKEPEEFSPYVSRGQELFHNTLNYMYSHYVAKDTPQLNSPVSESLDLKGLDIHPDVISKDKRTKSSNNATFHHNIIQRSMMNDDAVAALSALIAQISPEMQEENKFTIDTYKKLTEKQKEQLRELCESTQVIKLVDLDQNIKIDEDYSAIKDYARQAKTVLDKKYGEGNYVLFGPGNSPACLLSILADEGVATKIFPFSTKVLRGSCIDLLRQPLNDNDWDKYYTRIDWKQYFDSFGINSEEIERMKESGKVPVVLDYVYKGETINVLKSLFNKIGLNSDDFKFEDMSDLFVDDSEKQKQINNNFYSIFLDGKKIKLYSTCQNAGSVPEFYQDIANYEQSYDWHPFTKLLFFTHYDKSSE